MRDALNLITELDFDNWTKEDFHAVNMFLYDSGYLNSPTKAMLDILPKDKYELIKKAEQDQKFKGLDEVHNGYDRTVLKQSMTIIIQEFLNNIDDPSQCTQLTLAGMNMHKSIRFPKTSKVNPVPMPTVVPRALEYLHRRRAIEDKPYLKLPILKEFSYTNPAPFESIGDQARPEHLAEFIETAPYHWLEFWATARVGGGEICFPNLLVAALLFEQKFGYLPDFLPESELSKELKKQPRPPINISWARKGFTGQTNHELKTFATPGSIFERVNEERAEAPNDLWA